MLKTRGNKFQNIFSLNCNSFGEFRDTFAMNVEYYVYQTLNHYSNLQNGFGTDFCLF